MQDADERFDRLYLENAPRMVKMAAFLLGDPGLAGELTDEAFLIFLSKRQALEDHPNLPGWLAQTLKHLIADELKSARHRLERPLEPDIDIPASDSYEPPLSDLLPGGLKPKEREILLLFYEEQLSYEQISERLRISVLNCRTRLFRAKAHYRELADSENIFT